MKKTIGMVCVLMILAVSVQAASITINRPVNGEKLILGEAYQISWEASGTTNSFKITLWRSGVSMGVINSGLPPQTRSFRWTVGKMVQGNCPAGTGYQIKIKEKSLPVAAVSSGGFSIEKKYTPPEPVYDIQMIAPARGDRWELNSTQTIRWNYQSKMSNVCLKLYKGNQILGSITKMTPAAPRQFQWTVGKYISYSNTNETADPGNYRIGIAAVGAYSTHENQSGMSADFSIYDKKMEGLPKLNTGAMLNQGVAAINPGGLAPAQSLEPTIRVEQIIPANATVKKGDTIKVKIKIWNASDAFLTKGFEDGKVAKLTLRNGCYDDWYHFTPQKSGDLLITAANRLKRKSVRMSLNVIQPPPPVKPDLVIERIVVNPEILKASKSYSVAVEVKNIGAPIKRGQAFDLKLSANLPVTYQLQEELRGLNTNETTLFRFSSPFELPKRPMDIEFTAEVDEGHYVEEVNEHNNVKKKKTKSLAYPDFWLRNIRMTTFPRDKAFSLSAEVLNTGTLAVPAGTAVDIALYLDGEYFGKYYIKDGFPINTPYSAFFKMIPFSKIKRDRFDILMIVDLHNHITEEDEGNNRLEESLGAYW